MGVDYSKLDKAMSSMGANMDSRPIEQDGSPQRHKIQFELERGIEIEAAEFGAIETIAGMLSYNGEHAFLYINEPSKTREELIEIPAENAQRFHILKDCSTLQTMHRQGKSERYILIRNTSGIFPSYPLDEVYGRTLYDEEIDAKLLPCKNCLNLLSYKGKKYTGPNRCETTWRQFDIKEFINHYEPYFFDERYYRENSLDQSGNYTIDHAVIRDKLLRRLDYKCQGELEGGEQCGVQLKDHDNLLHMHHINGRRGDNSPENLKILCVLCHKSQYNHQHMRVKYADAMLIESRRRGK